MDGKDRADCGFSVQDAVSKRCSVRTYDPRPVEAGLRKKLLAYAEELHNPLGPGVRIQLIEKRTSSGGEKLGTYGVIRGADLYLGAAVPDEPYALEALGYDFEQLILYATSLGLGTCWLGGTFNRSAFAAAMDVKEHELLPIVSPVGYPGSKKSISERLMRRTTGADKRLPWDTLFFKEDFKTPLLPEDIPVLQFPLEMLRLAPSAVNRQPWRVVVRDGAIHFFEKHALGAKSAIDLQRIDVGIGICHFHLAALEQNLAGYFERSAPEFMIPEGMTYITSWVLD